ncbi:MAG: deoxynucleoside kinase, partial [Rhizobacter sp.]|nr:deoxynucleoside kinase [Chlorobiales bacterium]
MNGSVQGKKFIAISGNIGSGKSTLTAMLAKHYHWTPVMETADENPYLADFYSDMPRWSFHLQMFFLTDRFRQHRGILQRASSSVQDRTIYEDAEIFARNLFEMNAMPERDYKTYTALYREFTALLQPPDLVVYLNASVPKLVSQIQKRGRGYESKVPIDYLERLSHAYDRWFGEYA